MRQKLDTSIFGKSVVHDRREFARIDVWIGVRIQPLDPQRADALRTELSTEPSVWMPSTEPNLRELAGSSAGPESLLAQALLELTEQFVTLRAKVDQGTAPVIPAQLRQLSGGGGKIDADVALDSGDEFEIRLEPDDGETPPIRALGRVVHCADKQIGFTFSQIHQRDQAVLMRLIYKIQRRALRRAHAQGTEE